MYPEEIAAWPPQTCQAGASLLHGPEVFLGEEAPEATCHFLLLLVSARLCAAPGPALSMLPLPH